MSSLLADVAGRMLADAYDKGQQQRGQIKRDMERGQREAQARTGNGTTTPSPGARQA